MRFSEDIVPLKDLKVNPGKVVTHTQTAKRPVLLTSRGRGVAVIQSLAEFEEQSDQLEFVKAVAKGLLEEKQDKTLTLDELKADLGL
jgi:prevent-host-death family protein